MARSDVSQPPRPGEIWSLDENWKPPPSRSSTPEAGQQSKKIALVLKELCLSGKMDDEDINEWNEWSEWSSDPLDPIYRSLVDGQIVDLHWTWFKSRLSP